MTEYRIPPHEVEVRGEEIYRQIRDSVDAGNQGKFVVIDVENGDYEVDEEDVNATLRLWARRPGAITYGIRIGYPAAYTLGFRTVASR
jgi:hypothetical protein